MAETKNPIPEELIEQLFKQCKDPKDLLGGEGLLAQLKKRLLERAPGSRDGRTSGLRTPCH